MALSRRIRAFAGFVLFLSILPAAYLLGLWQGTGQTAGNTNEPQTNTGAPMVRADTTASEHFERIPNLNSDQSNTSSVNITVAGAATSLGRAPHTTPVRALSRSGQAKVGFAADLGEGVGLSAQEMEESDTAYIFRYQARGLEKCSLKVNVEHGLLSVSGQFSETTGNTERSSSFAQSQSLPGAVDPHSLKTELENGILTITLDKVGAKRQ